MQNCNGTWTTGTATIFDVCGICDGDGSDCTDRVDCDGLYRYVAGDAAINVLGVKDPTLPLLNADYNSSKVFDYCEVCRIPKIDYGKGLELNHDWNLSCGFDCGGDLNGQNILDSCGRCIDMEDVDHEIPHASCAADCDSELEYIDGILPTTDTEFNAWTWTWMATGYIVMTVQAA